MYSNVSSIAVPAAMLASSWTIIFELAKSSSPMVMSKPFPVALAVWSMKYRGKFSTTHDFGMLGNAIKRRHDPLLYQIRFSY